MVVSQKYNYQKQREKNERPVGGGRVFVSPKIKYSFNPIINLPVKFWGNIGISVILIIIIWLLLFSPFFVVREIIVEGNNQVTADAIINSIKSDQNIFRFNIKAAKSDIVKINPIINDVAIYRGIPNALKIVVLENKPTLVWVSGEDKYLVDNQGYVDKKITESDFSSLPQVVDEKKLSVKVGERIVSPSFILFLSKIDENFYSKTNIKLSRFEIKETTFDLYAHTDAGFFVKFDTTRSADKQLDDLKNIIVEHRENIHEYIDVRINGWAYFK